MISFCDIGFNIINKVLAFNTSASSEKQKFDGIQFDVEPYLLSADRDFLPPYWDTDLMTVWKYYVSYMKSCQNLINKSNTELYFGIAIPRWYENHLGNNELKHLQSIVDYVAIMDYNENSPVIIKDAENEMNNAAEFSKRVWIGVETQEIYPETVSFYEEGVLSMEEALQDIINVYGSKPHLSGISVHAYRHYKSLKN